MMVMMRRTTMMAAIMCTLFAATECLHINRCTGPFVPCHTSSNSNSNDTQNSNNSTNNDTNDSTKRQACKDKQTIELTSQLVNKLDYGPKDCWCTSKLAFYEPTNSIRLGDELMYICIRHNMYYWQNHPFPTSAFPCSPCHRHTPCRALSLHYTTNTHRHARLCCTSASRWGGSCYYRWEGGSRASCGKSTWSI